MQSEVAALMRGIEHPRLAAALALAEECGEVVRVVLDREVYGTPDEGRLGAEVGDVLLSLLELCDRYGLSAAECAAAAVEKLRQKAPEWREILGDRLERLRRRLDGPPDGDASEPA